MPPFFLLSRRMELPPAETDTESLFPLIGEIYAFFFSLLGEAFFSAEGDGGVSFHISDPPFFRDVLRPKPPVSPVPACVVALLLRMRIALFPGPGNASFFFFYFP